jgi:predicted CXXCH cytochrome family protein
VALACGLAALAWRLRPQPAVLGAADGELNEPPAADPGYLGPQACAACHARRVAEFQATRHFRACCLPTAEVMPPGFATGQGTYATRDPTLRFEMTQAGGDFLVTAVDVAGGEERTSARIDLVYGAGGTSDEMYFSWRGDRLYELPVAWLYPQNRWGTTSLNRYGTGDFSREATTRCLECHNTWYEHVAGTLNEYRRDSFILGVTCERCHGPGREHVAFHQAHPEADAPQAVVRPRRLTRDRQLELCTQCHSNAVTCRAPPFTYRPGEPLETCFRTAVSQHPEDDHVANQVQYLRRSKCFQKSDTLTCITCHDPHRPTDPASVRGSCLKCHQPADCAEQQRLPAAVRDDCVGCHMPRRVWMNVHFHTGDDRYVPTATRHEHRIAVDDAARQEVLVGWYHTQADARSREEAARLTAALVEHWLAEAERDRRDHRFLAAIGAVREAVRLDPGPATRERLRQAVAVQAGLDADLVQALRRVDEHRFADAIETLQKILLVKPDLALAHGKLGTVYAITGRSDLAVEHLQAAARYDPNDPYGYTMLGWLAYLQGRPEDAVAAYRHADEVEPFDAEINYHLGLALAKLGRWEEAVDCFRRVLTIDPKHAGGCQCLADALRRQGHASEALRLARRADRLTDGQNPDVLLTLAETYLDSGRLAEADDTAARALDVADTRNPAAVPSVRQRLEEIRARRRQGEAARQTGWTPFALLGVLGAAGVVGWCVWRQRRVGQNRPAM